MIEVSFFNRRVLHKYATFQLDRSSYHSVCAGKMKKRKSPEELL